PALHGVRLRAAAGAHRPAADADHRPNGPVSPRLRLDRHPLATVLLPLRRDVQLSRPVPARDGAAAPPSDGLTVPFQEGMAFFSPRQVPVVKELSQRTFLEMCGAAGPLEIHVAQTGSPGVSRRTLSQPFALVGRQANADVLLDDETVSARHAYLQIIHGR